MIRQFFLFSLLLFIHISYCNAEVSITRDKQLVLGVDLGVAVTNQLGSKVTFPLGYSTFSYTPDNTTASSARYGISLGRTFTLSPLNNLIIGLGYHRFSTLNVNGTLEQGITPPFYSANYEYSLQLSQLLAEAKFQHTWRQVFYPYLSAGIGAGFNLATQFNTTVPNYLTVTPAFTNHKNTSLSYSLGLGIDTLVASNVTVGAGYVFSDLGSVGLGTGTIRSRVLADYLKQSHLYMNTFLVQLNWYF